MKMKKKSNIYTITFIEKFDVNNITNLPEFGDIHTTVYYNNVYDAINYIKHITPYYNYAIIEEIPLGTNNYVTNRLLFELVNNKYIQIDEPNYLHKVTNFAIG